MRAVGPHIRKCGQVFGISNIASDTRLGICIARTLPGDPDVPVYVNVPGFNAERPDAEVELLSTGWQYSFHRVTEYLTDGLFSQMTTILDADSYYDWSPIIFRLFKIDGGGWGRSYSGVFGHLLSTDIPVSLRMRAVGGFVHSPEPFANFTQEYGKGFHLFLRCRQDLADGEIAYFAEPPPPCMGVIVEVKCPRPSRFRPASGETRMTYEEGSYL
jgi:hypothetical protein